jgi:hypothetical protein
VDGESARVAFTEPWAVERVIAALRKATSLAATRAGASQANDPEVSEIPLSGRGRSFVHGRAARTPWHADGLEPARRQAGRRGTARAMARRRRRRSSA